jgi:hypothetical protein
MSATYALPGDVITVRGELTVWSPDGTLRHVAPGYYALVSQNHNILTLIPVRDDGEGAMMAFGESLFVPRMVLSFDAVNLTEFTFPLREAPGKE